MIKITQGNTKHKKLLDKHGIRLISFNLPAIETCPAAGFCKSLCFARAGQYVINQNLIKNNFDNFVYTTDLTRSKVLNIIDKWTVNGGTAWFKVAELIDVENRKLNIKESNFVKVFLKSIKNLNYSVIRLHDSGDIYGQSYLNKLKIIAEKLPDKLIYAYTKSLLLDFSNLPSNLKVIQSYGGKHDYLINDSKPHAKIFSSFDKLHKAGYIDANTTDYEAIKGTVKLGLVYHGTKKLTEKQINVLNKEVKKCIK